MEKIRVALVGTGGMGKVHYANYQHLPEYEVAAVCDSAPASRALAEEWGLPHFTGIGEMLDNTEVDLVDICTPTFLHHDMVMESLAHGKNTITEKPIALSLKNAREMLDEAEKQGCLLFVAQVLQFTKEVGYLRDAVRSGIYGKPLDACFERLSACPRWAADGWLFDAKKSGLLPYDLHIHDLDVIVSLFRKPESFSFTSCSGTGKFNADIPWTARWRVYFENGMMINDGTTLKAYQFDHEPVTFDTADEVMVSTGINVPPCGWYYNELKHFAECIRENKPSPYVTREQLLTVMKILEEISAQWRK